MENEMTKFQEGQEVEVCCNEYRGDMATGPKYRKQWRKAKIILAQRPITWTDDTLYEVQFPDGDRAVVHTEHIRAVDPAEEHPGLAEPDDDTSEPMGSDFTERE